MLLILVLLSTCSTATHHHHHHHHHGHGYQSFDQESSTTIGLPQDSTYGPSIVSLTKYNRDVHGPTIFHPNTGRLINLEDYPNYSVIVPLAPDSPTATSNQVFVSRRLSGPGEFHVVAPAGHGVMAVVESMDLRLAPTGCNDFIQFGEVDSGVETAGTCGKVDNLDGSFAPSSLIGPRTFLSPSGNMKVLFYHGYLWGLVRDFNFDILDPSRNPVLRVEIVFTAYKACDAWNVTTQRLLHNYRSCTNTLERETCISSQLFCDRNTNCAFEDNFGSDEYISNCLPKILNLLLPGVRKPFLSAWRPPTTLSSVSSTSAPTPTPTPTTSITPTALPLSDATTTTSTPTSTTTTTTTINTISTTPLTSDSVLELSTIIPSMGVPFRTQLQDHFFDISPGTVIVAHSPTQATTPTVSTTIETTTTVSPISAITKNTIILPPEFEQAVNFPQEQAIDTNLSFSSPSNHSPVLQLNMTFAEKNNTLSVEEDEGQIIEQLYNPSNDVNDASNYQNKDTPLLELGSSADETSTILWIIFVVFIVFAALCILRLYCCRNRVIWIVPNPKALRVRRKRRETSVYANASHFPEVHVSGADCGSMKKVRVSGTKETPPSYDILFPKPSLHDADVLP